MGLTPSGCDLQRHDAHAGAEPPFGQLGLPDEDHADDGSRAEGEELVDLLDDGRAVLPGALTLEQHPLGAVGGEVLLVGSLSRRLWAVVGLHC